MGMRAEGPAVALRLPERGPRLRWLALLYGLVLFIWLGLEDDFVQPVVLLGWLMAGLLLLFWLSGRYGGRMVAARLLPPGGALLGALLGAGASLCTVALMFFKNARHAHLYPDYPVEMMAAVLERAPDWALAGALVGLALALIWLAARP